MAVIQKPDALSLSGNLKKFEVHSGGTVLFMLKEGETVIYEGSYEPGVNGVVYIDVKDIIDSRLSFLLSHSIFYQQTSICKSFTAKIDGIDYAFTVLRGGIANLADSVANWLTGNFLTWQPTSKPVTYYSPEWITYYALQASNIKLKAYLPGDTEQIVTLGSCEAGKAFTCNVQYAGVAGLLAQQYPTHYDVWVEDLSGNRLSYIQRYLYSDPKSELEQWFLYENSLGGIDTIRAYGDTDFESVHTHGISEIDEVASEYRVDTERFYNKNTGYLDEYERRWLLDFFPSRSKYVHYNGAIRKIVVTEDDAKYAVSDLPSSYTFRYRFSDDTAGLLNLIRNEDQIPEVITIPNLESPDFSLPPRLSEYPRVPLHEGVLFPAFDPYNQESSVTTLGSILAAAVHEVLTRIAAGEGGGELVNVLRSTSSEIESDYSVFSSLRTIREIQKYVSEKTYEFIKSTDTQTELTDENALSSLRTLLEIAKANEDLLEDISRKYLRKDIEDTAFEKITFLKGIIASSLSEFTDLIASGKITAENIDVNNHLLTNTLKVILQADLQAILLRGQMNSETFASGMFGHGMRLRKNGEDWELELDNITVRKVMTVYELIVQEMRYQGGQHIYGPAGGKLTKVTDKGSHWRCEHDGTTDIITGAQVLCQRFDVGTRLENPTGASVYRDSRTKRYWRLVTSYGSGWFNLSKTDCEHGSDVPEVEDQVAVFGHRTNRSWQNAMVLVSTAPDAPYLAYYAGINSYSTVGKEVKRDGNLEGIVDAQFGQLHGYGSYAENVYLKGQFRLSNNKLIEDAINEANRQEYIGALNLLREYDARFDFKYWGEDGEKVQIDFNTINPYKVMILCDRDNVIVTEDNLAIKIIL